MTVTVGGLDIDLDDFVGSDGLGHTINQPATVGGGGEVYAEEPMFPDRAFNQMLNELSNGYTPTVVSVTDATKTLALTDRNSIQACNRATAQTITIPANASVAFAVGTVIIFEQHGVGQVTLDGDTGVTVNGSSGGAVAISGQYLGAYLRKTATNTWIAIGSLS